MQPVSDTPKLPFQNQRLVHHHHPSLVQDQAKLDKKRERNRIAASKCRQRKLEKIQTLGKTIIFVWFPFDVFIVVFIEEQVFRLRRENEDLRNFSEQLNDNLEKIKSQLDFHLSQGCNLDSPKLDPLPSFSSTSSSKAGSLLPPDSTCLS